MPRRPRPTTDTLRAPKPRRWAASMLLILAVAAAGVILADAALHAALDAHRTLETLGERRSSW